MPCRIHIKSFEKLTTIELYYILQARAQVFGVEQKSSYQDIDDKDFKAIHITVHKEKDLVGYCRIVPPKLAEKEKSPKRYISDQQESYPSIDKLLVLEKHRGYGLATNLLDQALSYCAATYPKKPIVICAQAYLVKFFQSLGFQQASDIYIKNKLKLVDMVHGSKRKIKFKKIKQPKPASKTTFLGQLLGLFLIVLMIALIAAIVYLGNPS